MNFNHIFHSLEHLKRASVMRKLWRAIALFAIPCLPALAVTLPFTDGFEAGNFSAWNGGRTNGFSVSATSAHTGRYAAGGTSSLGIGTDYYQEAYFGDHPRASGAPVANGLYVKFSHKFDSDFNLGTAADSHKVLLINFEDSNDLRREQIILNVFGTTPIGTNRGHYMIENIHWNVDRSFGSGQLFRQNRGTAVAYRPGEWDTIKIYIRPNTVGQTDGTVRVWINGEIKIEHTNISMRQTAYNPNLVIIGYYAPDTDIQGTRRWDDITVSESDPDSNDTVAPSAPTRLR